MKKRRETPSHSVPGLFIFLLLGIFAVFSLVLVLFGAKAYRNTVELTGHHNTERILSSFVRNNLRNSDFRNGIYYIEDSIPRLKLFDPEDDEYAKYIYVYDGYLRELYIEAEKDFYPDAGEEICPAENFSAQIEDGMLAVHISAEEIDHETFFALRCEEGAA